tara:strand:+ start:1739 stop:1972 length:234 start_codon:yes stop_codon:yes gene_type:complete
MNNITAFLYIIFLVGIAGATFAYMWKLMTTTLDDFNKPRNIHPEMTDVKSGEELLVFRSSDDEDDTDNGGDIIIVRK